MWKFDLVDGFRVRGIIKVVVPIVSMSKNFWKIWVGGHVKEGLTLGGKEGSIPSGNREQEQEQA